MFILLCNVTTFFLFVQYDKIILNIFGYCCTCSLKCS